MNKTKIGIFLSLMLVLGFCSSCKEQKSNNKLLLNEVLVNNESNYQDDYGVHSAWIENIQQIIRQRRPCRLLSEIQQPAG